ncbi:hypothetical protein QJR26_12150 [Clostridium baratii]
MAFENGDQIKDYLGRCLEKYKKDKNIFEKALTMINFYMRRIDWPNCIEDLDRQSVSLLGNDIITLTWGVGKYINNPYMKWDGVPDGFKEDYTFFYNCIGEVYNQYWHGRFYPNRLNNLSYVKCEDDMYILRFSKNNDEKIDIEISRNEIGYLIDNLKNIAGGTENE